MDHIVSVCVPRQVTYESGAHVSLSRTIKVKVRVCDLMISTEESITLEGSGKYPSVV